MAEINNFGLTSLPVTQWLEHVFSVWKVMGLTPVRTRISFIVAYNNKQTLNFKTQVAISFFKPFHSSPSSG